MTTNRTTVLGGIWADGAPDIPESTVPETLTTYAKSDILPSEIEAGWPYKKIVDSATLNEVMKRITSLLTTLESNGLLPWCILTPYVAGARCLGSDGMVYTALSDHDGQDPISSPTYWGQRQGLISVQTFTTSGTYTPSAGTKSVIVECQGGGAAGGGAAATGVSEYSIGAGGGSGAYCKGRYTTGFSGATVTIGIGGVAIEGYTGGNGGTTSFGALMSAPGGNGGGTAGPSALPFAITGNVACDIATGGTIVNTKGAPGGYSIPAATACVAGQGASSLLGMGGGINSVGENGFAASGYGSGGGGATQGPSGSALFGGSGKPGVVIIYEYA